MNGFFLLIPFFLIRFGLLSLWKRDGIRRAAHFAPLAQQEWPAYLVYQLSNAAIFLYLCFLTVLIEPSWQFFFGLIVYLLGLILLAVSVADFARPSGMGMNEEGIYRFSCNPMYVSYFLCFAGSAALTRSLLLFGFVLLFQISSHWIILSEERWCSLEFGEAYRQYQKRVRRYF